MPSFFIVQGSHALKNKRYTGNKLGLDLNFFFERKEKMVIIFIRVHVRPRARSKNNFRIIFAKSVLLILGVRI